MLERVSVTGMCCDDGAYRTEDGDPQWIEWSRSFVLQICLSRPCVEFPYRLSISHSRNRYNCWPFSMFGRLSQLARHLTRPSPNYTHRSAAFTACSMTSSAITNDAGRRTIHTAGCIIIGDEVLGGKVQWLSRDVADIRADHV